MSSLLRGSTNYVWCTTSVLGKGATASVFQGVNKVNGEPVAVKTFNQLSHMRPQEVQLREFEVLRKVNHKNIVKLLAIEEEQHEGHGKVIIMELCTGGSLFNILDDPENTYGLEESAFLQVLDDTSSGMKHLRDNNLIHRDLKPGNIMKFICDDRTTIYKLTDFGAARELPDGHQFASLYGTEEYLHPDLYEKAVLRKQVGKTFGATVDLWSIGVTLYHVATGNLPFRPYGGRRNKTQMHMITTTKACGVISGIQTSENGPVEWSRELPSNCQLSLGLRRIVTPLLAGLLEVDAKKVWSFDRFFKEVRHVLARKLVHVFYVNRASAIKVYVPPSDTYEHLQQYIEEQTECKPMDQLILCKNALFVDVVGENSRAAGYPDTSAQPLMLFSTDLPDVSVIPMPALPDFPHFSAVVSVTNDADQAKMGCSLGHVCKRRIERCAHGTQQMRNSVEYFTDHLKNEVRQLERNTQHLAEMTRAHELVMEANALSQNCVSTLTTSTNSNNKQQQQRGSASSSPGNTNYREELARLSRPFMEQTCRTVQLLYQQTVAELQLLQQWHAAVRDVLCPAERRAPYKAQTQVELLRDSWQHLVRDRATRTLAYNDEQFHILERIKITGTNQRIKSLLEEECIPAFNQYAELLSDWYKMGQTIYKRYRILSTDVAAYKQEINELSEQMEIDQRRYKMEMQTLVESGKTVNTPQDLVNCPPEKMLKIQKETDKERAEIRKLLTENSDYMSQLRKHMDSFFTQID